MNPMLVLANFAAELIILVVVFWVDNLTNRG